MVRELLKAFTYHRMVRRWSMQRYMSRTYCLCSLQKTFGGSRTDTLPFTSADRYRLFAGFDESGFTELRIHYWVLSSLIRMDLSNFKNRV